jgi:hypothetical protein
VEDNRHEQVARRYLKALKYGTHAMRFVTSPSGAGSAEQWVRAQFPVQLKACRRRQAETKLIVLIDADTLTVQQRSAQLDQTLREAGLPPIPNDSREIARLVPRRNIETWILCLNDVPAEETTDYKKTRDDWPDLIPTAATTLYAWTRENAKVPTSCIDSLLIGIKELQKIGLG